MAQPVVPCAAASRSRCWPVAMRNSTMLFGRPPTRLQETLLREDMARLIPRDEPGSRVAERPAEAALRQRMSDTLTRVQVRGGGGLHAAQLVAWLVVCLSCWPACCTCRPSASESPFECMPSVCCTLRSSGLALLRRMSAFQSSASDFQNCSPISCAFASSCEPWNMFLPTLCALAPPCELSNCPLQPCALLSFITACAPASCCAGHPAARC